MAGVSAPTVSKVLNGRAGVASETRRRVEQVIQDHGYRRQEYTEPGTPIVEAIFQRLDSPWVLEIIRGVAQMVQPRRLTVAVSEMRGQLTPDEAWTQDILVRRPTGVVAVSAKLTGQQIAQLASRAIPLVILDPSGVPTHATPAVGATNWNGGLGRRPARALALAANGSLGPAFQTFPLSQAAQAHAALETRATTGKVILVPDSRPVT